MSNASGQPKDLPAYLRPVLKRWWLIALVVPLVTIGTYLYYDHKPKTFESTTELYVQPTTLQQLVFGSKGEGQSKIENYALLISTAAVGERAEANIAKRKGAGAVPAGGVFAEGIEKTSFIVITATAGSPEGAADLANAYATAFIELQSGQVRREAKRAAEATEKQLAQIPRRRSTIRRREALEAQAQQLTLLATQPQSEAGIRQVEPAVPVAAPIGHDPQGNAIFALVLSLALAIAAAYGLEYLNRKLTRVEDVEEVYDLPILTEVPQVDSPAPLDHEAAAMEKMLRGPFNRLQANLDLLARERPIRTILVASAAPDEGKSVVTRNLALAYREAGRTVAVVDADFRKASLGGLLAAEEGMGLSDILTGAASFGQVVQEVRVQGTANGNGHRRSPTGLASRPTHPDGELAMVPAGGDRGNLSAAFASTEMRDALRTAADAYGMVIVDSPPVLAVSDALPLLSEVDAVVLVTRLGVSTRDSARRLLGELERVPDVQIAGVVVNGIPPRVYRARSYGYYDG